LDPWPEALMSWVAWLLLAVNLWISWHNAKVTGL
jgi:hypothetical protein